MVPPVRTGPESGTIPIRLEKHWLQGLPVLRLAAACLLLCPLLFIVGLLVRLGVDPEVCLLVLALMSPVVAYIVTVVLRTRPGVVEMDPFGVRLLRGGRTVREVRFGPQTRVGVVKVGYWDDISPGMTFRAMGVDENEFSLYERRGFGPLFGFRFTGGGKRLVVSRKHGWDLNGIHWMWLPIMREVDRHGMQMEPSLVKYLQRRREMGLPVP